MIQAQEYLNQNYPKETRQNITDLSISHQELVGKLDLSEFVNLEYLDCSDNQLTSLNISNHKQLKYLNCNDNKLTNLIYFYLPQLEVFSCSDNYLTSLDYSVLNSDKLFFLNVNSNNLQEQDLSVLSHLVNLKHLGIGNGDEKKINQHIHNQWTGSLESLQGLSKLRLLEINNTDISAGVEYLPFSLKEIGCSSNERPTSLVTAIVEQLNNSQYFRYDEKQNKYVSTKTEPTYSAQEWLDQHYLISERTNIRYLDLSHENLTGSLRLVGFSNLREFACWGNNLTSLDLSNNSQLIKFDCGENQLTNLIVNNCQNLEHLVCHKNQLTSLDLANCNKLEKLYCGENKLTELNLTTNNQLIELCCQQNQLTQLILPADSKLQRLVVWSNYLTDLDWSVLASDKLTGLSLTSNNFSASDLSVFSRFTQLKELYLGNNDQDKIDQGIYNRFKGSCEPLQNLTKLWSLSIINTDINSGAEYLPTSLTDFYYSTDLRPNCQLTKIVPFLDYWTWKDLHTNFDLELRKEWEQLNFTKEQTKSWLELGFKPSEYNKAQEWQELQQLTGQGLIEKFIEKYPDTYGNKLRWIPYEKLEIEKDNHGNPKIIGAGGFSTIYKARFTSPELWGKEVALKCFNKSQNIAVEFLMEIANTKLVENSSGFNFGHIVPCYGISQDPSTGNYLMVMDYIKDGNLRDYLKNNIRRLTWSEKLNKLHDIAEGLMHIHQQDLVHHDLHSGNILNNGTLFTYIADLGLTRSVNYQKKKGKIFGVLSYLAPEVLQKQPYTQESDVYSCGILAYEVLTGYSPFAKQTHDATLGARICCGLRPEFPSQVKYPQLLVDLITKCWDADPSQRPTAKELKETLNSWQREVEYQRDTIFARQVEEADKHNRSLPNHIRYPQYQVHSQDFCFSQAIDTKKITELINKPNKSFRIISHDHTIDWENNVLMNPQTESSSIPRSSLDSSSRSFKRSASLSLEVSSSKEIKLAEQVTDLMDLDEQEQNQVVEMSPKK